MNGTFVAFNGVNASVHSRDGGVPDEDIDLGLLAAQIVAPQVTLEQLRDLRAKREADVLHLASVAADANSRPVALDPRFLPAASD